MMDLSDKVEIVKASLNPEILENTPRDELETKVFLPTLPACKDLFVELLENSEKLLKDGSEITDINEIITLSLKVCIDLLNSVNSAIIKINEIVLKKTDHGFSIPKNIASILLKVFSHCQKSETIYGNLFSNVTELLMIVFRKAHELQTNFFIFLNNTVSFNCAFQNELNLLVEVMELLAEIGKVLIGLDIKTLATQWKGYMQLTDTYIQNLKMWLDITQPVRFLASDIKIRLQKIWSVVEADKGNVSNDESEKQLMKDLKVGNFILKIIVKLCELYNDHLGDCHKDLLSLLVTLYGFSSPYLGNYKLPDGVMDYIERNITIAAGPLLTNLYQDQSFIAEFYKLSNSCCSEVSGDRQEKFINRGNNTGFILLTTAIMKKIYNSELNIQQLWIKETSLVSVILNAIQNSGVEMNMDITINRVEIPGMSDLYESVLTHTAAYIIATTTETLFGEIEKLLISKIIQPHFWTALLASDLFYLLARFGNNELRLTQVQYFVKLIADWPSNNRLCPEWMFVLCLTERLIKMLPTYQAQCILSENQYLFSLEIDFPGMINNEFDLDAVCKAIDKFLNSENNQVFLFHDMLEKLNRVPYLNLTDQDINKVLSYIVQLWRLSRTSCNTIGHIEMIEKLLITLCKASAFLLGHMETETLNKILFDMVNLVQDNKCISCKLSVLKFLKRLASKEIKNSGLHTEVFQQIAQLFGLLINDTSIFVNLTALNTFKYFAEVTKHVQIISLTPQVDRNVEQSIKTYLQGTFLPNDTSNLLEYDKYLEHLNEIKFEHKCRKSIKSETVVNGFEGVNNHIMRTSVIDNNDFFKNNKTNEHFQNQTVNEISCVFKELGNVVNKVTMNCKNSNVSNFPEDSGSNNLNTLLNELKNCLEKCKTLQ